jgi:KipI family sensor histidine kinase inhibitor
MTTVEIAPYGDSALLATASGGTTEQRWDLVRRLADAVRAPGVVDVVATYDAVLLEFDCGRTTFEEVAAAVRAVRFPRSASASVAFRIPVCYGGEHGPDLADVATQLGIPAADVIRLHAATPWTVRFRGSPAGAPMMDGSLFPTPITRRSQPRIRVPAGSVALAGHQSVIYPVASPGGWRIIGRTPLRLLELSYRPGDILRFSRV